MNPLKTVLLIDDDDSLRRVGIHARGRGAQGHHGCGRHHGLQAFQAHTVDLVLTDIRMPEMDGLEPAHAAEGDAIRPFRVIILIAHGTIDSVVDAMKLGAFDYLTKPFNREQLESRRAKGAFEVAALTTETAICGRSLPSAFRLRA